MNAGTFIDPIKRHPFILIGGVVLVIVYFQLRGSKTSSQQSNASGVYTMTADPNQVALQAQAQDNATKVSLASIQADTAKGYFSMMRDVQGGQVAAARDVSLAEITAGQQNANAAIGAGMFSTAVQGLTANYISQLKANGASNIAYTSSGSGSGNVSGGSGGNGGGTGSWSISNAGTWGTTTLNPAGSSVINTANLQIEQLFNNVLRAGTGIAPLETPIITDGGGSTQQTVSNSPSVTPSLLPHESGNGGSRNDPIFLNWINGQHLPTVTDITPAANSAFGWVGSFVNPNTGQSQTIH